MSKTISEFVESVRPALVAVVQRSLPGAQITAIEALKSSLR